MNIPTTLPDHLTIAERKAVRDLFAGIEILPISSLLYEADEFRVISANRKIPDDFIYIPKRNRLLCTVDGETREIGPGEIMMVSAGLSHGVTMADRTESYEVFALHMHALDDSGNRFFERLRSPFGTLPNPDHWFEKLGVCTHLMGRQDETAVIYFQQMVTWLVYEQLLRGNQIKELPQKMDKRISRLVAHIRKNYTKSLTVTEMAGFCNLSLSRFREVFTKNVGISPKKYVQRVRLSKARSLLATEPLLSVEEVANQVGISDAHYFHAIYKEMFEETPKQRKGLEQ